MTEIRSSERIRGGSRPQSHADAQAGARPERAHTGPILVDISTVTGVPVDVVFTMKTAQIARWIVVGGMIGRAGAKLSGWDVSWLQVLAPAITIWLLWSWLSMSHDLLLWAKAQLDKRMPVEGLIADKTGGQDA